MFHEGTTLIRPSIMFMPDQLRYDSLGCTGNKVIKTPNIDALAGEGTLFTSECSLPPFYGYGTSENTRWSDT